MAAFSSSAFSTSAFSTSAFDFDAVATESRGGFDERHYKKYREYLEKLTQATSVKDKREAAKELMELPVETTELQKLTEKPILKGTLRLTPKIDYRILQKEISLINAYLDMMNMHRLDMLREQDDEVGFLMIIQ